MQEAVRNVGLEPKGQQADRDVFHKRANVALYVWIQLTGRKTRKDSKNNLWGIPGEYKEEVP